MNYYKFVSWDAVELEKVKAGRVPLAIAAADRGGVRDENHLPEHTRRRKSRRRMAQGERERAEERKARCLWGMEYAPHLRRCKHYDEL